MAALFTVGTSHSYSFFISQPIFAFSYHLSQVAAIWFLLTLGRMK